MDKSETATTQEILGLIAVGESHVVEFKKSPPRPSDLAERICGFANSDKGGMVIVGVVDKSLEIVGVRDVPDAVDNVLQAARLCKPTVHLITEPPRVITLQGKQLVIADIPPNNGILYQAGGTFWIKRGTNNVPLDAEGVEEFLYRRGKLAWETQLVKHATMDDIDPLKFRQYAEEVAINAKRTPRLTDQDEMLLKLDCAGYDQKTGVLRPTNAGLLLFGKFPSDFLNQGEVVALHYQDNSGLARHNSRHTFTGTINEQIDQAAVILNIWIPTTEWIEGFHRVEAVALPLEALREAIVNAVVHRD